VRIKHLWATTLEVGRDDVTLGSEQDQKETAPKLDA
jgi:hypothetical protein